MSDVLYDATRMGLSLIRNTWVTHKPFLVYFKPTGRCDLRCKICNRWQKDSSRNEELSIDEIRSFLVAFRRHGAAVLIIWGGEPTLRRNLPDILSIAKALGYRTSICTNCNSLVNIADRIMPMLDTLLCSLDGYGVNHDEARGIGGLFDRVVEGIRTARKYGKTRIKIWASLSKTNIDDIKPLAELARELGVWIEYFPISTIVGYNDSIVLEGDSLRTAFDKVFEVKRAGYPVWNTDVVLRKMRDGSSIRCSFGKTSIHLDHVGNVYACEDPEGNRLHDWGSIKDLDIDRLLASKEHAKVGERLASCNRCRLPCVIELGDSPFIAYSGMFWQTITRK